MQMNMMDILAYIGFFIYMFKRLIKEANEYKVLGNQAFAGSEFERAIGEYENALVVSPLSQKKDRAIYFANIAACHLKLGKPKDARDMCTRAIELDPEYTKALLRRAQANEKIGSYTALSEALEDYKALSKMAGLDAYTRKECSRAQRTLPDVIKAQMEKEKDEMMGKLKDLGNTLLGKFGLSTDNFQFQQNPNSGGYSMNFVNGEKGSPAK
ncbi:hypothetical protein CLU79DRAFT_737717 [Phycomyces nitens]|nr:hypothetical protein CLU79DRAFT_737717 [Phycomyces nitens]